MRITKKTDTKEGTTIGMPKAIKAYWKLKELEDIEDEIGLDLIIVFKALKNGIATRDENGNVVFSSFCEKLVADTFDLGNGEKHRAYILRGDGMFYLKDYGKTWALTKEELK